MFAAAAVATLFQAGPIGAQPMTEPNISTSIIPVEHVVMRTKKPYPEVKAALESRLGRLDGNIRSLLSENKVDELRAALEKVAGKDGLAIHYVAAHGDWLVLNGGRRNGNVYYVGNVLSAVVMTRQNFGAGLYAPLRVAVYEDENGTTFEYDKPSTLFAQFHDPKIDEVAHSLDDRLAALLAGVSR
ncbi:MAG TPA: DUF302 domain-containing protein [Xanthobacteraceae bacterium]|jgi:uncharacterized protein (DUF302 family)|nr:DUF302 domain-containing protein [Xanthobacteraceae bacterium]